MSEEQDVSLALAWCNTNRSKLGKILSPLEFKLRIQEFMRLLQSDAVGAILYARKNLLKYIQSA